MKDNGLVGPSTLANHYPPDACGLFLGRSHRHRCSRRSKPGDLDRAAAARGGGSPRGAEPMPRFLDRVEIAGQGAAGPLRANVNLLALLVDFSDNYGHGDRESDRHRQSAVCAGSGRPGIGAGLLRRCLLRPGGRRHPEPAEHDRLAAMHRRPTPTTSTGRAGWGPIRGTPAEWWRTWWRWWTPVVDFSQYDNDGDGYVDTLLVIHAGTGAEWSTNVNDMWSHASSITNMGGTAPTWTGSRWTVLHRARVPGSRHGAASSTDMTIGVICHETGHGMWGLPDLYDLDLSSAGIGQWGLMSYGDWNGPANEFLLGFSVTDGSSPALPSAWSRVAMGFDVPPLVTSVGTVPGARRGHSRRHCRFESVLLGGAPQEYFLMENRQAGGRIRPVPSGQRTADLARRRGKVVHQRRFGQQLGVRSLPSPTAGDLRTSHYLVALEQADGLDNLEPEPTAATQRSVPWRDHQHRLAAVDRQREEPRTDPGTTPCARRAPRSR